MSSCMKKKIINVICPKLNPFFVVILLQEETSEFIQNDNSNLTSGDCGVWDPNVDETVSSCSFWMEGVMLTCTGRFCDFIVLLEIFRRQQTSLWSRNKLHIKLSRHKKNRSKEIQKNKKNIMILKTIYYHKSFFFNF